MGATLQFHTIPAGAGLSGLVIFQITPYVYVVPSLKYRSKEMHTAKLHGQTPRNAIYRGV